MISLKRWWILVSISVLVFLFISFAHAATDTTRSSTPLDPANLVGDCDTSVSTGQKKFVSGSKKDQVFKTVLLAIHGWNGSCKATFGEGKNSLFNSTSEKQIFDWDCLDYKSHQERLPEAMQKLGNRLADLKRDGYENVLMVTHSTGGLVAIDLMLEQFERISASSSDNDQPIYPVIYDIMAWAAPVYGLKDGVHTGAWLLNFFGISDDGVLPELLQSNLLSNRRERLKSYFREFPQLPPAKRSGNRTRISFYHGAEKDWVVENIPDRDRTAWLGNNNTGLSSVIDTKMAHLESVSRSGDALRHSLPANLVENLAIIRAPFKPRFDKVFLTTSSDFFLSRCVQQMRVVKGFTHLASTNIDLAEEEMKAFLKLMLSDDFPHSISVDTQLIDGLLHAFENGLFDHNRAKLAARVLQTLLEDYDLLQKNNLMPGHGLNPYQMKVLKLVAALWKNLRETNFADLQDLPDGISKLDLENLLAATNAKFLSSPHDNVKHQAIRVLTAEIGTMDSRVAINANLVDRIFNRFYVANVASYSAQTKQLLAKFAENAVRRHDDIGLQTLTALRQDVTFYGASTPVWATFQDDKLVEKIVSASNLDTFDMTQSKWLAAASGLKFDIYANVGSKGNNSTLAKQMFLDFKTNRTRIENITATGTKIDPTPWAKLPGFGINPAFPAADFDNLVAEKPIIQKDWTGLRRLHRM